MFFVHGGAADSVNASSIVRNHVEDIIIRNWSVFGAEEARDKGA